MCSVGVGWEPLDDIVERLVDGLEAGGAHEDTLTPANRHGPGRGSVTAAIPDLVANGVAPAKEAFSSEAQPHPLTRARRDSVTGLPCRVERTATLTPASPRAAQNPDSNPRDPHTWESADTVCLRRSLERATAAIYEFVPRKKDGPEPVQFPGGGKTQGGSTNHLADDDSQTRGNAPLALRR